MVFVATFKAESGRDFTDFIISDTLAEAILLTHKICKENKCKVVNVKEFIEYKKLEK